ncbi:MAG: hypothetical protein KF797_07875 [Flavobacteriales bacterium]|nr:hypothetical protein [Flavobacteriales bacterium]
MRILLTTWTALLLGCLLPAQAQGQDVLDKIAKDICPCMGSISDQMPKDTLTIKLGVCMISAAMPYQKELKKKYGVDLERLDGPTGEKLGHLVAAKLVTSCPGFAEMAIRLAQEETPPPPPSVPNERTVHGAVQEITPGQFLTITVKTDNGRSYEFLLLEHVPNVEQVSQDPGKAKGFHAKWSYVEREFFDPYTRTYKIHRVLTGVEP